MRELAGLTTLVTCLDLRVFLGCVVYDRTVAHPTYITLCSPTIRAHALSVSVVSFHNFPFHFSLPFLSNYDNLNIDSHACQEKSLDAV